MTACAQTPAISILLESLKWKRDGSERGARRSKNELGWCGQWSTKREIKLRESRSVLSALPRILICRRVVISWSTSCGKKDYQRKSAYCCILLQERGLGYSWPLSYVSVKSKLQHAPPPRAFDFFENYCSNSPLPGPKCRSNAPH